MINYVPKMNIKNIENYRSGLPTSSSRNGMQFTKPSGTYHPKISSGTVTHRVVEQDLAEEYGVSRTPVREVIRELVKEGVLISIPNILANKEVNLEVHAVKFDAAQDKDIVKTITGKYMVHKTPQTLTYDDDGNMLTDSEGWTYTYNAENRPVTVINIDNTKKFEYKYDYMGRRIEEKYYTSSGTWTLSKHMKFVYDGFKKIAEYDGSDNLLKLYTWQPVDLDVPLWVKDGTNYYYYIADGNKNIRFMVDTSGNEVASYDYNPFGKVVVSSGAYKDTNKYRFSSEYHDDETRLVSYLRRYYEGNLGKWLSKDPIGENGGIALYGFSTNDAINSWDNFGLWARLSSNKTSIYYNRWCAERGDTLGELAKKKEYGGNSEEWGCLWPVSTPSGEPNYSRNGKILTGHVYDAINLVASPPSSSVNNTPLRYRLLSIVRNGAPKTWRKMTGIKIAEDIMKKAQEGKTPLTDVMIMGHGGWLDDDGVHDKEKDFDISVLEQAYGKIAQGKDQFSLAKKRIGPPRCWFARNAKVHFLGCSSSGYASAFAKTYLRKGAKAYGTNQAIGLRNQNGGVKVLFYKPGHSRVTEDLNWNDKTLYQGWLWKSFGGI